MAESDHLFAEVLRLRNEVAEIKHTTNAQVRFNNEIKDAVVEQLKGDQTLIDVFLAVDGVLSQKDIIESVKGTKSGVSRKLIALRDLDLIEPIDKVGASVIYRRTNFAKVINLASLVKKIKKS